MTRFSFNIHYILIKWFIVVTLFLVGSMHAIEKVETNKGVATKVAQPKSSQKSIAQKQHAPQKVLAWLGGTTLFMLMTSLIIYKRYFKVTDKRRVSDEDRNTTKGNDSRNHPFLSDGSNHDNDSKHATPLPAYESSNDNQTISSDDASKKEEVSDDIESSKKNTLSNDGHEPDNDVTQSHGINQNPEDNNNEPNVTIKTPIKEKLRFKWERNSCFFNASLQVLLQVIPFSTPGGVPTILGWRKRLEGNTSRAALITRLFINLVEDVYSSDTTKATTDRIQENLKELRKELGERFLKINSGGFYDPEVAIDELLQKIDDAFKTTDWVSQLKGKYQPGVPISIQEVETIVAQRQLLDRNLPIRSLLGAIKLDCYASFRAAPDYYIECNSSLATTACDAFNIVPIDRNFLVDPSRKPKIKEQTNIHNRDIWLPKIIIAPDLMFVPTNTGGKKINYPFDDYVFLGEKYKLVAIIVNFPIHIVTFTEDPNTKQWSVYNDIDNVVEQIPLKYVKNVYEYSHPTWGKAAPAYLFYQRENRMLSEAPRSIKIPLWKGRLQRVPFDSKGDKWFKDYKQLKTTLDEQILFKVVEEGILQQLQEELNRLFDKHCQSIVASSKSIPEEVPISKLVEKFKKAVEQYEMGKDLQVLSLIGNELSIPYAEKFHNGIIKEEEKNKILERSLRASLEKIIPTLSNAQKKKPTQEELFNKGIIRVPFVENVVALKNKIIKKVEKLKNKQIPHTLNLNNIEKMVYEAIEKATLTKFPQLKESDREEDRLYGYLDLVDSILFTLGYSSVDFF